MIYRFEDFLKIIKGDFVCNVGGHKISSNAVDFDTYKNYGISSVSVENGILVIELKAFQAFTTEINSNANWVKEHKQNFGAEPSFF